MKTLTYILAILLLSACTVKKKATEREKFRTVETSTVGVKINGKFETKSEQLYKRTTTQYQPVDPDKPMKVGGLIYYNTIVTIVEEFGSLNYYGRFDGVALLKSAEEKISSGSKRTSSVDVTRPTTWWAIIGVVVVLAVLAYLKIPPGGID